jgi:hypothetical protein
MFKHANTENDPQAEGYLLALSHVRSHYNRQNDRRGYLREEDQAAAASVLKAVEDLRRAVTGERLEGTPWADPEQDFGDTTIWTGVDLSQFHGPSAFVRYRGEAYVWQVIWSHYDTGGLTLYASDPKQLRAQLIWAVVALDAAVARRGEEAAKAQEATDAR